MRRIVFIAVVSLAGCVSAAAAGPKRYVQRGKASWYGTDWHGRKTASGERFNKHAFTGAHRSLPFGTIVRVVNLRNKRSVKVRINDRGPYVRGRIIDVSEAAARRLKMRKAGVVPCKLIVVRYGKGRRGKRPLRRRHHWR